MLRAFTRDLGLMTSLQYQEEPSLVVPDNELSQDISTCVSGQVNTKDFSLFIYICLLLRIRDIVHHFD